jgi:hypothetical protein
MALYGVIIEITVPLRKSLGDIKYEQELFTQLVY